MFTGQPDYQASGNDRYGICREIHYVTLSGGEEPVLEEFGHTCEYQTRNEGDGYGVPAQQLRAGRIPACKPCNERIGEKHRKMRIPVKTDTQKIPAEVYVRRAESVETEKHYHQYIDDK